MVTQSLTFLGLILTTGSVLAQDIKGTVVHSFSESHSLIQTETTIYRIRRASLRPDDLAKLKIPGSTVAITLPSGSIDLEWKYTEPQITAQNRTAISEAASVIGDKLTLKGRVMTSFQEDHFLVSANDRIYRVKSAAAPQLLRSKLSVNGSLIEITVPKSAVVLDWQVAGPQTAAGNRMPAQEIKDEVLEAGDTLYIRGAVLPSLSEPYYLIQSSNQIFMIPRSAVDTKQTEFIVPGAHVAVNLRARDVFFKWSVAQ